MFDRASLLIRYIVSDAPAGESKVSVARDQSRLWIHKLWVDPSSTSIKEVPLSIPKELTHACLPHNVSNSIGFPSRRSMVLYVVCEVTAMNDCVTCVSGLSRLAAMTIVPPYRCSTVMGAADSICSIWSIYNNSQVYRKEMGSQKITKITI